MTRLFSRTLLLFAPCALLFSEGAAASAPSLIPAPVRMEIAEGCFEIECDTPVFATGAARAEAVKLIDALAPAMGCRLALTDDKKAKTAIALAIDDALEKDLGAEGYRLHVTKERVELRAAAPAGLFYGIQTIRQLLPPDILRAAPSPDVAWTIPCVEITDYPRFGWRGLLVDPARHFIPKRDMMRYIDAMALHKLNRLQIHFTDGQGWRIEIKKYPLLTEIGSHWHNTMGQHNDKGRIYGGYYTQDDIRELVRYAAERHVTLVPEIEMPFHAGAAIVSYPELGFDPEELAALPIDERRQKAGDLIVPRPSTVAFLKDVLDEVMEMFPGEYIHIGGDEANAGRWAEVPEMQKQMEQLGVKDVHELHSWFIRQMDAHIAERGRKMIGWDEILQGGLAEGATVMSWRGTDGCLAAARAGHDVVMAQTSHTYFDYGQSHDAATEPAGFGGAVIKLETVYTFDPVPDDLTPEQARHILGGQAQLWGELIPCEQHREYQTYPRACALTDILWSPEAHRDYAQFHEGLEFHTKRLEAAGIHYRPLDPRP